MKPRDADEALERANPFPRDEEIPWAATEQGRAVLSNVLEGRDQSPPARWRPRPRFLAHLGAAVLTFVVVGVVMGRFLLLEPVAPPAGLVRPSASSAPSAATEPTGDTESRAPTHSPSAVGLEAIVEGSRDIVSGTVSEVALLPEAAGAELEVFVRDVVKGDPDIRGTVLILVLGFPEVLDDLGFVQERSGDPARLAGRLVGRQLVVLARGSLAESTHRATAGLDGDTEVYVQTGERLERLGYFLVGRADPEARTIGDLKRALSGGDSE